MFGFDWPELIIIGIVALVFIGPEDLPDMFRQLGRFTAKLRQMSREFSRAMEQAAKDTGVGDVAKDFKSSTSPKALGLDKVREAADKFEKWDPMKNAAKPAVAKANSMTTFPLTPPPMPATPMPTALAANGVVDDAAEMADEMADDLAEHGADGAVAPTIHGPNTQALIDKQALRAEVLAEQTEKLKAIEAGTYVPTSATANVPTSAPAAVTPPLVTPAPVAAASPPSAPAKPAPNPGATKAEGDAALTPVAPPEPTADLTSALVKPKPKTKRKKAEEA